MLMLLLVLPVGIAITVHCWWVGHGDSVVTVDCVGVPTGIQVLFAVADSRSGDVRVSSSTTSDTTRWPLYSAPGVSW